MPSIRVIEEACRGVLSDKVTERRKCVTELQRHLSSSSYVDLLHANSENNQGFSWNELFQEVSLGFLKEDEHSAKLLTGYEHIRSVFMVLKLAVNLANSKDKVRLKVTNLLNHISNVMDRESTWSRFASEYTKLLLKEVLENRLVLREVPAKAFTDFIEYYVNIYLSGSKDVDDILLFHVIRELIRFCSKGTIVNSSLLCNFFKEVISGFRKRQLTCSQLESLFGCCLIFCHCAASDCRMQLCKLGEDVFTSVLVMLKERAFQRFKPLLLQFLKIQMACHHPKGVSSSEDGMMTADKKLWKKHLIELCEFCLEKIRLLSTSVRPGNLKSMLLDQEELYLIVDVFNQVCSFDFVEVYDDEELSQVPKRQKKELMSPNVIVDNIYSMINQSDAVIIWLQVLCCLLEKYPESICPNVDIFNSFTNALFHLQLNCKSYEILSYVMKCFYALLRAVKYGGKSVMFEDVWQKIYESILRTVTLKQCVSEGYSLISLLIQMRIVRRNKDVVKLYQSEVSAISEASLQTLQTIFCHGFLENEESAAVDQRLRMLDWLLPAPVAIADMEPSQSATSIGRVSPAKTVSPVLTAELVFRAILVDQSDFQSVKVAARTEQNFSCLDTSALENGYLKSAFVQPFVELVNRREEVDELVDEERRPKIIVFKSVQDKVLELLLRDCGYLLNESVELNILQSVSVINCCVITVTVIGLLVKFRLLSLAQLARNRHCDVLQKLLRRVKSLLHSVTEETTKTSRKILTNSLNLLELFYDWRGSKSFCQTMTQFCREVTSEDFVQLLQNILFSTSNSAEPKNHSTEKDSAVLSDFAERNWSPENFLSRLDDKWRLSVVKIMGHMCKYGRSPLTSPLRPREASKSVVGSNIAIQTSLLNRLLGEGFDLESLDNVKMAIVVMSELLHPQVHLTETQSNNLLLLLKRCCQSHYKDHDINACCLEMLAKFAQQLKVAASKTTVMNIINHFWGFVVKGKCGAFVELAVGKSLVAMAKCKAFEWDENDFRLDTNSASPMCLVKLLESSYPSVSMFVAENIPLLFGGDLKASKTDEHHVKILGYVCQTIDNSVGKLSNESLGSLDAERNLTASYIYTLVNIMKTSSFCLKPGFMAICDLLKKFPFILKTVKFAIEKLATILGYPSRDHFVSSHLSYVFSKINNKNSDEWENYLIWLLTSATTSDEFYQKNYKLMVPFQFVSGSRNLRDSICNLLKRSWEELVEECFSSIMAGFILPGLALGLNPSNSAAEEVPKISKRSSESHYKELCKTLTEGKVNSLILRNRNEMVVCVLKCLYDPNEPHFPPPNFPYYGPQAVQATLEFLAKTCSAGETSLIKVLCQSQDALQEVLLRLQENIAASFVPAEVYAATMSYCLVVKMVLEEPAPSLIAGWAYFLQDAVYTVVSYIRKFCKMNGFSEVTLKWCQLLNDVVSEAVNVSPEELEKYLILIVNTMVEVVEAGQSEKLTNQARVLLSFIVIERETVFNDSLKLLAPFPNRSEFFTLNTRLSELQSSSQISLTEAVKSFLKRLDCYKGVFRSEGLQQLRMMLHENKEQVADLVRELKDLRFSSECCTTMIYKLIISLVHVAFDFATEENVAVEAAMCLGEIGPVALSTFVLINEYNQQKYPWKAIESVLKDNTVQQRHNFIFHKLHSYILDSNVEAKRLASDTLKLLLGTKTGFQFITNYNQLTKSCKQEDFDHLDKYLKPFLTMKAPARLSLGNSSKSEVLSCSNFLPADSMCTYEEWLCKFTSALLDFCRNSCELFAHLMPLCQSRVDFCEPFLPFLIHAVLSGDGGTGQRRGVISEYINGFLERAFQSGTAYSRTSTPTSSLGTSDSSDSKGFVYKNKKTISTILEIVKFLRLQKRPKTDICNKYENNFWLNLDYLLLSEAAYSQNANLTALMYAELWLNTNRHLFLSWKRGGSSGSLESFSTDDEVNFKRCQDLLLKIYRCMGDCDAMAGCGTGHLKSLSSRLAYYEQQGRWDRALTTFNLLLRSEANMSRIPTSVSMLMFKMGVDKVGEIWKREDEDDIQSVNFNYECAWRMTNWSLPVLNDKEPDVSFEKAIYSGLVAFRDVHADRFTVATTKGYQSVIQQFRNDSFETVGNLYKCLSHLASLNRLEECFHLRKRRDVEQLPDITSAWSCLENLYESNYAVKESTLCLVTSALKTWRLADIQCPIIKRETVCILEKQVKLARENGIYQWAETYLSDLRKMDGTREQRLSWRFEEARILWDYNERDLAKGLLHSLIADVSKNESMTNSSLMANCCYCLGLWSMELRSENASVILAEHLEKAINIWQLNARDSANICHLTEAYLTAARFADRHYQNVSMYKKSDGFDSKLLISSQAVERRIDDDKQMQKAKHRFKQQIEMDKAEIKQCEEKHRTYLLKSLKYYLACLRLSSDHDSRIFRIVGLWNENSKVEMVNSILNDNIDQIPTYKFLPLVRQLSARMKLPELNSTFHNVLDKLIYKVCVDHPYHTLLILLALSNASKDKLAQQSVGAGGDEEGRVLAAKNMVERLKKEKSLGNTVAAMETVCDVLIDFAYFEGPTRKGELVDINKTHRILKLKNVDRVPPLTINIPVSPTGKYDNVTSIVKYRPKFKQCDGLSCPKQITCLGSDGKERMELIKGNDDLRQDAVMQQVFELVNVMLTKNKETSKRGLIVRTYKVVPLSRMSGILEWCSPSKPLSGFLTNDVFRKRYDTTALSVAKCFKSVKEATLSSFDERLRVFNRVCDNLKPVFRYFFFEEFPQPSVWYERRTAYIKSVATSSIVGHILGLGDRHVNNILIDMNTAEVIHIDLGIAFEQGKLLSIPETVPFRLTRDILDGMGAHGYEGTFRRCCEHTLSVMRDSEEIILTISGVLLYDPLYHWTLTPLQKQKLQDTMPDTLDDSNGSMHEDLPKSGDEDEVNKLAERVLHRLKEKLVGQEDATTLGVAGQVSHLIREATDQRNLCLIFAGWQAYL